MSLSLSRSLSKHHPARLLLLALLAALLHVALAPPAVADKSEADKSEIVPEAASGIGTVKTASYREAAAVTANPHASDAARRILKQGGSAIDATIAAQLVLGLVEPQSSGIGGGAFMLHWDAEQRELNSWNGRETAPAAVDEAYFLDADGGKMSFFDAVIGGHSVGVPGVLAMLDAAHRAHGKLPWSALFQPAIELAEEGFAISPRLHTLLQRMPQVAANPAITDYFFHHRGEGLEPKPVGHVLKNPDYANTLRLLAHKGADEFYRGDLAERIVTAVRSDPNRQGRMTVADMKNYRAQQNTAVCGGFLQYRVCGAPPPSSGGTTVLAILGMMEHAAVSDWRHGFIEASRLAFADRNRYLADPDFVAVPTAGLVAADYLVSRAALIDSDRRLTVVPAGTPAGAPPRVAAASPELPSTTHLSIVDRWGNIVSMTSSIETAFGSRVMVGGFLLNNQLTDFSFAPQDEGGELIANRPQGGKRPRSSMAPVVVFRGDEPLLALGSPGGARIIDYVALSLYRVLAQGLPLGEAIAAGHIVAMGDRVELESASFSETEQQALKALGHPVTEADQTSGLHGILLREGKLFGAADPRREGAVSGY